MIPGGFVKQPWCYLSLVLPSVWIICLPSRIGNPSQLLPFLLPITCFLLFPPPTPICSPFLISVVTHVVYLYVSICSSEPQMKEHDTFVFLGLGSICLQSSGLYFSL